MNLRNLAIVAFVAAFGALLAWFWFGEVKVPALPETSTEAVRDVADSDDPAPTPSNRDSAAAPPIKPPEPVRTSSAVVPGAPLVRSTPAPPRPFVAVGPPATTASDPLKTEQEEAKKDLEGVRFMIRDFRTRLGQNPVGSNGEIMRAMTGANEANARLGPPPGQTLNDNGELLDRWGSPYFFHQLSKTTMEIRSAGPDRQLYTADDLIAK